LILSFIERARRRFLWNESLAQAAFAAALLLGGVVLLLVLGTQLLDWRWLVALAVAGVCVGIFRTRQRLISRYKVAVLVDSRAGLHDALSTALHFSEEGSRSAGLPAIREFQKRQAERLIPSVNLETAVPFRIPRALYVMGLLALVASSLFALRYGVRRSLDLQAPLNQVVMDGFGLHAPEDKVANRPKKSGDPKQADALDEQGRPIPKSEQKRAGELDAASPSALSTVNDPDMNNEKAQSASAGKDGSEKGEGAGKEGGEKGSPEKAENGQQSAGKNGADNPAGSKDGPQQGEPGASQQGGDNKNASLLSKMKDAMQNLMSKAKPQPNNAAGQKQGGSQGQKGQSTQAKSGEKGASGESKEGGQQDQQEGQQGQQAGDQDNSDSAQGKGNGKSSDQQAAAQPGSGVGKQDGAKDIRAAEQKAAMGKLSEVIGKRSAQVSGEMMVESQSGPQQLRTQYSRRAATHGQSGGEVNRDEVPVELQGYVQQYFQEVRKQERSGTAARKAAPKSPSTPEPK
jgi:hypothetical protein